MKWNKLGKIFSADKNFDWMHSHASNPMAIHLHDNRFRIYFTCRDKNSRGHVAHVEIDLKNPTEVLALSEVPSLGPGHIGCFDDSGVTGAWFLTVKDKVYLYYLGWNLGITVPFRNAIGLAELDGKTDTFRRVSIAPVLDRNEFDPFSLSYPCVLKVDKTFRMWYGTHLTTGSSEKDMTHVIRHTSSNQFKRWKASGEISIPLKDEKEYALSRPSVLLENGIYKMWFSHRGESYRIGYAESKDGIVWERNDSFAGINISKDGFDSEMICYPFVFRHGQNLYMLYNGNGYGRSGFGIAILS